MHWRWPGRSGVVLSLQLRALAFVVRPSVRRKFVLTGLKASTLFYELPPEGRPNYEPYYTVSSCSPVVRFRGLLYVSLRDAARVRGHRLVPPWEHLPVGRIRASEELQLLSQ